MTSDAMREIMGRALLVVNPGVRELRFQEAKQALGGERLRISPKPRPEVRPPKDGTGHQGMPSERLAVHRPVRLEPLKVAIKICPLKRHLDVAA